MSTRVGQKNAYGGEVKICLENQIHILNAIVRSFSLAQFSSVACVQRYESVVGGPRFATI